MLPYHQQEPFSSGSCTVLHCEEEELYAHLVKAAKCSEGIDVLTQYMADYHQKDLVPGSKESKTMEKYISLLKTNGLPWLTEKYELVLAI